MGFFVQVSLCISAPLCSQALLLRPLPPLHLLLASWSPALPLLSLSGLARGSPLGPSLYTRDLWMSSPSLSCKYPLPADDSPAGIMHLLLPGGPHRLRGVSPESQTTPPTTISNIFLPVAVKTLGVILVFFTLKTLKTLLRHQPISEPGGPCPQDTQAAV